MKQSGNMFNTRIKNIKVIDLLPGLSVIISLAGLICIYAPLELYFTNIGDFWYDFSLLLPAAIESFLVFTFLLSLVFFMILCKSPQIYNKLILVSFVILLCIYIQGNFLTSQLPPMDGTAIDWNTLAANDLITVITILIIGSIIGIVASKISVKKMCIIAAFVSSGLFIMLMCTLAVLCFTNYGLTSKRNMKATANNEFLVSSNENFIILLLDAVDSHTFWKVLEDNPEYKDIFDDFTYYPNTLGAYSFTSRSIPYILSGEWFENKEPFEVYQTEALKNSLLFKQLEEQQYSLGIYDQDLNMNLDVGLERFTNQVEIKQQVISWKDFLLTYLSMGGIKYAPYNMKQPCYNRINQRNTLLLDNQNIDESEKFWSYNTTFYNFLKENDMETTTRNMFKFIHLEGAHVPYQYNANLEVIKDATYETNVEACITLMRTYLDSLKESGVYDNSIIIFMSDHGYGSSDIYNPDGVLELRQNPMLLVKGVNENHDFQVSRAPISYEDLQMAYTKLLEGKRGDEIFEAQEGDERERRYLFYIYVDEDTMMEYIQTGDVWEPGQLNPTGKIFKLK